MLFRSVMLRKSRFYDLVFRKDFAMKLAATVSEAKKESYFRALGKNIIKHKYAYMMMLPVLVFYIIFHYKPMYGAIIAFKDYSPTMGIWGSPWVGFKHFQSFFTGMYFGRLLRNTVLISFYSLLFGFTAPILFALLLNELRSSKYKRVIQTVSYFPHFISMVVICGLIKTFTLSDGIINDLIAALGGERSPMLQNPSLFRPIYIISDIWQNLGWDSVIYLAALAGIDTQLYEACEVDGGRKFAKMWHITLPGILPTIIIMFIMRIGSLLNVGYEKIILLYNAFTYETADVITSFVYRKGLLELNWSYSTAIGLFNSVVNFIFLIAVNGISRKLNDTSLW